LRGDPRDPLEVRPGLEMPARAAYHHRAYPGLRTERIHRVVQPLDERLIVGVVDLGPAQRHRRHAARIHVPQDARVRHFPSFEYL
jgi:hypothetical protein